VSALKTRIKELKEFQPENSQKLINADKDTKKEEEKVQRERAKEKEKQRKKEEKAYPSCYRTYSLGAKLVGARVSKKFKNEFYEGTVTAYDAKEKWYKVKYDDGDAEELDDAALKEKLIFVPGTAASNGKDCINFRRKFLPCIWEVTHAVWTALCDEHKVPKDNPTRLGNIYRPDDVFMSAEPYSWNRGSGQDEDEEMYVEYSDSDERDEALKSIVSIEDRFFDREETVHDSRDFAELFLEHLFDSFGGKERVLIPSPVFFRDRIEWPKGWKAKKKEAYAEAFEGLINTFCKDPPKGSYYDSYVPTKDAASVIKKYLDKKTSSVEKIVDEAGGFGKNAKKRGRGK